MRDGGRIAAAIEILDTLQSRHQPVKDAVRDWGKAHRFAGSGDRAWIGGLVLDALRHQLSVSTAMQSDTPRALAIGTAGRVWGMDADQLDEIFESDDHAPDALSDAEKDGLKRDISDAPAYVRGDFPEWLEESLTRAFGESVAEEGRLLSARAPVDLRINILKSDPDRAEKEVASKLKTVEASHLTRLGLRLPLRDPRAKAAAAESIPAYGKGWVEVQDVGSQVAALAAAPRAGMKILDYCAGAGGKTLALSALLNNTGQVHAWDLDWRRLKAIWPRLKRAGSRNVQVHDGKEAEALGDLTGKMDVVFCDAPCTGTGTWRRRPDAKWRLKTAALEKRMEEQDTVLERAQAYVKPAGRLVYVTCSVLPEENGDRVQAFLDRGAPFKPVSALEVLKASGGLTAGASETLEACVTDLGALQLSPGRTDTDGFYICVLEREA
ncbi:RsmB/NOP family class I SAM-dependent RNA methyltransferase [Maricaulis sp. D1M11]|uniref:RsmB/NOP family class I SAM-dependent RNA methyltransferase n=1 Tax=Maricaulis sp. D1M11 TaxID=3076117 RepID=UPI0039B4D56A